MSHPGYDGMFVPRERDPRMRRTTQSRGEREVYEEYLEHYRLTLELKCEGLTPEQLARAAVPPSKISLLGLVRHMARVEQSWFRRVIEGQDLERLFNGEDEDGGFTIPRVDEGAVEEAFALWRAEVAHAEEVLRSVDLDQLVRIPGDEIEIEVRDLVVHMIEEYARHCGHADLVRECLDGRAGQ